MAKCSICKQTRDKGLIVYMRLKPVCRFDINPDCVAKLGIMLAAKDRKKREKADKAVFRARKEKLDDTVPNWTKKAQKAFNWFVREIDFYEPCISCGRTENEFKFTSTRGGIWDCGHYRSVASAPELRFEPFNAYKQCKYCNSNLSGNHVEFRISLVVRIGADLLAWLEGPHKPKRYRVEDLKEIARYYNAKARELKRSREAKT